MGIPGPLGANSPKRKVVLHDMPVNVVAVDRRRNQSLVPIFNAAAHFYACLKPSTSSCLHLPLWTNDLQSVSLVWFDISLQYLFQVRTEGQHCQGKLSPTRLTASD